GSGVSCVLVPATAAHFWLKVDNGIGRVLDSLNNHCSFNSTAVSSVHSSCQGRKPLKQKRSVYNKDSMSSHSDGIGGPKNGFCTKSCQLKVRKIIKMSNT